jgi:hypothetical protein
MHQQNQHQMQSQQPVFQNPPQVITRKDINYVKIDNQ